MKNLVRKRGINIDFLPYKLYEPLDELYQFRNSSMHGETDISKEDYEILCKYKNQELFKGLSIKKLELSNTILHPTVDEIANFIGLPKSPNSNRYQEGITTHTKSRKVRCLCGFPALCLLFKLAKFGLM